MFRREEPAGYGRSPAGPVSAHSMAKEESTCPPYTLPPEVQQLLPSCRTFGAKAWDERRLRFRWLVALSVVIAETSQNDRDGALCARLQAIGKT
jgi:hypothetical protein